MAKLTCLDEEDRKLLIETKQKLDEANKLLGELMETIEILSDSKMMKNIKQGQADIKAGKVKDLRSLLKEEEACWNTQSSYRRQAEHFYKKLDIKAKTQIRDCLISLEDEAYTGKRLRGDLKDNYSLRAGKIRIIYTVSKQEKTVYVVAIGPRGTIYQ